MGRMEFKNGRTFLDGKEFRIFSGSVHYFRMHPELWKDRLLKLKACGLNTVETYVPWNLHEPRQGIFNFNGFADIEAYLGLCAELGLKVILRPGPYICSEWDWGALPSWLFNIQGMRIRCNNKPYLDAVESFFRELFSRVKRFQSTEDGPVIAVQVENEYGSYGNDKDYLAALRDIITGSGIEVVLLTSDGATAEHLSAGTLDDVWATVNFGADPDTSLDALEKFRPGSPLMCTEFWNGQGMRWGLSRRLRDPQVVASCIKKILERGSGINLYMFHGGTNFGFMNGALLLPDIPYSPFITSYDTDAVLNEAGDPTGKFYEFRKIFGKYNPGFDAAAPVPAPSVKKAYGEVMLTHSAALFQNLEKISSGIYKSATPDCMETFGQSYGFILYRTRMKGPADSFRLAVVEPRDRAHIFVNGICKAVLYRNDKNFEVTVSLTEKENQIDILVENMGRVNFGHAMEDERKGITHGVKINGFQYHFGWEIVSLPMDDITPLKYGKLDKMQTCPAFYKGSLKIDDAPADTFLKIPYGTKGVCWINGFNLGRYWNTQGPQFALYVPAPLLKRGENTIEILELEGLNGFSVRFTDRMEV